MIFTSKDEIVLMSKKENIEGQERRQVCQLVRKIDNEVTEKDS